MTLLTRWEGLKGNPNLKGHRPFFWELCQIRDKAPFATRFRDQAEKIKAKRKAMEPGATWGMRNTRVRHGFRGLEAFPFKAPKSVYPQEKHETQIVQSIIHIFARWKQGHPCTLKAALSTSCSFVISLSTFRQPDWENMFRCDPKSTGVVFYKLDSAKRPPRFLRVPNFCT